MFLSRQPKWSEDETVCARSVTNEVHCFHDADFSMYPVHNIASFQLTFIGANSNLDKIYWLILFYLPVNQYLFWSIQYSPTSWKGALVQHKFNKNTIYRLKIKILTVSPPQVNCHHSTKAFICPCEWSIHSL